MLALDRLASDVELLLDQVPSVILAIENTVSPSLVFWLIPDSQVSRSIRQIPPRPAVSDIPMWA